MGMGLGVRQSIFTLLNSALFMFHLGFYRCYHFRDLTKMIYPHCSAIAAAIPGKVFAAAAARNFGPLRLVS